MLLVQFYFIFRKKLIGITLDDDASGRKVSFSLDSALHVLLRFSSFVASAGFAGLQNSYKL